MLRSEIQAGPNSESARPPARELAPGGQARAHDPVELFDLIHALTQEVAAVRNSAEAAARDREDFRVRLQAMTLRENELEANWIDAQDQLLRRDNELQRMVRQLSDQRDRLAVERAELARQRDELSAQRGELVRERDSLIAERSKLAESHDLLASRVDHLC